MSNTDAPDSTMSLRGRIASSTGWFVAYSALALIVVPFLLIKQEAATLGGALPLLMAGGLMFSGLWGTATVFMSDPETGEPVLGRKAMAAVMLWMTMLLSLVTWIMASVLVAIGDDNWDGYNVLKSGGWLTYAVFGLLPVVAYFVLMKAMASRRIVTNAWWTIASAVCLAASMLAPWFWVGFKAYTDYHAL